MPPSDLYYFVILLSPLLLVTQFCNCVPYHQPWSMEDSHHCFINADISLKQCILFLFLIWLLLWNTDSWRAFLFYIVYCHFSEAFLPFFTFCDNNSCIFASLLCSLLFPNFQEPSQQDLTMSPRVLVKLLNPREGKLFPYCQAFLYPNLQSTLNSHSESRTTHTVPVPHCLYLLDPQAAFMYSPAYQQLGWLVVYLWCWSGFQQVDGHSSQCRHVVVQVRGLSIIFREGESVGH